MKALKCIRKKGSLDNYLLNTEPRDVRSTFGSLLRSYIEKKQADPNFVVPYIPKTRKFWKPKREKDQHMYSVIWKPPETRYKDHTEYEFNRYDENAPPRPEILRSEEMVLDKKKRKQKSLLTEKPESSEEEKKAAQRKMIMEKFQYNANPNLKQVYDQVLADFPVNEETTKKDKAVNKKIKGSKKKRAAKVKSISEKKPEGEKKLMKAFREKILDLQDK